LVKCDNCKGVDTTQVWVYHKLLRECQFADDVTLLATTHRVAEEASKTYQSTASDFGLAVSI